MYISDGNTLIKTMSEMYNWFPWDLTLLLNVTQGKSKENNILLIALN